MPGKMYWLGLTACCEPFKIVLSDYDGEDIIEALKTEISDILDSGEYDGRPIPVYIMTGVLGAIRVEVLILYIFGGAPLMLDPSVAIEGGGTRDGHLVTGNTFISRMYADNNSMVYSLGYVDSPSEAYEYAVKYTRTNPLVKNAGISDDTASLYISSNSESVQTVGKIQRLGGSVFDVYAFNNTESSLIRTDKDFIGGEPYEQNGIHRGKYEVILYGGDPVIVPVGAICGAQGDFFRVWVPNDAGFIECTTSMLSYGDIPNESLYVDYDDLADAYAMYSAKLVSEEQEADANAESDAGDVPDFDYEEFYDE